jgi:hypothetical protein
MALPHSRHNWLADVTTPDRRAVKDTRPSLGNTASMVAPLRSRATRSGIASAHKPVFVALPPRVRAARGRLARLPLHDSKVEGLVGFDNADQARWLVQCGCLIWPAIFVPQTSTRRCTSGVEGPSAIRATVTRRRHVPKAAPPSRHSADSHAFAPACQPLPSARRACNRFLPPEPMARLGFASHRPAWLHSPLAPRAALKS